MMEMNNKGAKAWLHWFLISESLILLLALAGPGYPYTLRQRGDHALLARLFFEEPTYLHALTINFMAINLFIGGVLFAVWLIPRHRGKRSTFVETFPRLSSRTNITQGQPSRRCVS
jgi:hypothetical protein